MTIISSFLKNKTKNIIFYTQNKIKIYIGILNNALYINKTVLSIILAYIIFSIGVTIIPPFSASTSVIAYVI